MSSLNKIILIGNLSFDPDIKVTTNGHNVAKLSLAVDRPSGTNTANPQTDFIPVVAWNEQADYVQGNLQKGDQVLVIGRISERTYEDSEGVRKWITEIESRSIQKLSGSQKTENNSESFTETATETTENPFSENTEKNSENSPEIKADAPKVSEDNFDFNDPFQSKESPIESNKEEENVPF